MRNDNSSGKNKKGRGKRPADSGRNEYVRSFKVNLDDDVRDSKYVSDKPSNKGAIYFSNPPKYNSRDASGGQKPRADIGDPNLSPEIRRAMKSLEASSKPTRPPQKPAPATHSGKQPAAPTQRAVGSDLAGKAPTAKRKRKKRPGISPAIMIVLIVFVCSCVLSLISISCMNDVLAINRSDEPVEVSIPEKAKTDEIVDILSDAGLISQPTFCKLFLSLRAKLMDTDLEEEEYLGGMYYLKSSMGIETMLNEFKQKRSATTVSLYFPEGWTVQQIFEKLQKYGVCSYDYLMSALKNVKFSVDFSSEIYSNESVYLNLEGFLFPDTYEFFENENANSVIRKFLSNFNLKWTPEYAQRAADLGYTMREILIIASIIEREAANAEQMPIISSVLHNRLDAPASFPFLECDSTSDYVTNYIKPNISDVKVASYNQLYNTYLCDSLPAGPICNPGEAAILAALYPDDTSYYFFQHDDDGEIYLGRTKAEHDRNKLAVVEANNS